MSLAVVACTCGGAQMRARKILERSGCKYWLDVPIYSGAKKFKEFLATLPPTMSQKDIDILKCGVEGKSSYIIIIGLTPTRMVWSDIKNNNTKAVLDAEIIINEFA